MAIALVIAISLGFSGPGHATDGKTGGMAEGCRSILDGDAERSIANLRNLSREEIIRLSREAATAEGFTIDDLSAAEEERFRAEWFEVTIKSPAVLVSFCGYFARGALPGIGADVGHGSLRLDREVFVLSAEPNPGVESVETEPDPGENDCEKPYPVTFEMDGRTTKHIFCETGSKFVLTSSYRADGEGGWTKVE